MERLLSDNNVMKVLVRMMKQSDHRYDKSVDRCDEVLEGMVGVGMCDHQCLQVWWSIWRHEELAGVMQVLACVMKVLASLII